MNIIKLLKIAVTGLFLSLSISANAALISLQASSSNVTVGQTFTIDLVVSELEDLGVSTYDIDLSFDSNIFNYVGTQFGSELDVLGLGSIQFDTLLSMNLLNLFEVSLDSADDIQFLQSESFALASVEFISVDIGSGDFSLTLNAFGDAFGNPFMPNPELNTTTVIVSPAVNSVNQPPIVLLMMSMLILLMGCHKKQKQVGRLHFKSVDYL